MIVLSRVLQEYRKRKLSACGNNCWIGRNCNFQGNIIIGNSVSIGREANFVSTIASINIHDYVILGPKVTIYSGDHPIDVVGYHIAEINDKHKEGRIGDDADVVIEAGCWIGTQAIILKGVRIGRGSVVAAGAIVTRDVPPYSIYMGVPERRVVSRFSNEQIIEHEQKLRCRNIPIV